MSDLNENPDNENLDSEAEHFNSYVGCNADRTADQAHPIDGVPVVAAPSHRASKYFTSGDKDAQRMKLDLLGRHISGGHRLASRITTITVMAARVGIRGVRKSPRIMVATLLSVLILIGVVLTRPSKRMPIAELPSVQPGLASLAKNSQLSQADDESKKITMAPPAVDLAALESKTLESNRSPKQSDESGKQASSAPSLENMSVATEQFVAPLPVQDESTTPKPSVSQTLQPDVLAAKMSPALSGEEKLSLAPAMPMPMQAEPIRDQHEPPSPGTRNVGRSDTISVVQTKSKITLSDPPLNEVVQNLKPVPQDMAESRRAEADSQNSERGSEGTSSRMKAVSGEEVTSRLFPSTAVIMPPEQVRDGVVSGRSSQVADVTAVRVADPTKGELEPNEQRQVVASSSEPISEGSLAKAMSQKGTTEAELSGYSKAMGVSGIDSSKPEIGGLPPVSGADAVATNRSKSEDSAINPATAASVASTSAVNEGAPPLSAATSATTLAKSFKDLKQSALNAHVALPDDAIQSPTSRLVPAADKAPVTTLQPTSARNHSETAEDLVNSRPTDTKQGKPDPVSDRTQLQDRRDERAVGTAITDKSPPAKEPDALTSGIDRRDPANDTNKTGSQLNEVSSGVNQQDWVTVPNNQMILDESASAAVSARPLVESGFPPQRDAHAHADKVVDFELEPAKTAKRSNVSIVDPVRIGVERSARESRSEQSDHIQQFAYTPHVVERGENFWTISRQYFGTGTYWIALWKCNSAKIPEIDKLRVGDVILVPPVEDLDLTAADPRVRRRTSNRGLSELKDSAQFEVENPVSSRSSNRQASRVGTTSIQRVRRSNGGVDQETPN